MKVLHIQYRMPPAGNACFRLHEAMRKFGIESSILTIEPSIKRNNVNSKKRNVKSLAIKIYTYIKGKIIKKSLKPNAYFYSYLPKWSRSIANESLVKEADAIYFHWIAGGCLSLKEIEKIVQLGKPIIFFMHDMWDFTGGCHHSFDCQNYKTGCINCKMFKKKSNLPHNQIKEKRELFSKYKNVAFISPSKWMAECAASSYAIPSHNIYVVSNLVDETNFKPIEKKTAREILNLPQHKTIITFGCQAGTKNPFKGWSYLQEAIAKLPNTNIHILIYGSDYNKETVDQIKYPITFLGPVLDETKLALICNATDVFVSPSLAESFGLTFLENNLCGTPVVGFNNTAIGEIVKTEITGYLAENKNADDLATGIEYLIAKKLKVSIRDSYSSEQIVKSHIEIINSIDLELKKYKDDKKDN